MSDDDTIRVSRAALTDAFIQMQRRMRAGLGYEMSCRDAADKAVSAIIAATTDRIQDFHVTDTLSEMVRTGEAKVIDGEMSQSPCIMIGEDEAELDDDGSLGISLWYPDFHAPMQQQPKVRIELYHTRAADDITIFYDGDRDGWAVLMDKTVQHETHMECIEKDAEVVFIPAWNTIESNAGALIAAPTQEQPRRFTPTERLVLHDAAEALECDINHQHSQGCNELSVQLRDMLAESSESAKPNASHVPGKQSSHSWHHGCDESLWRCDCGERTDFLESSESSVKP